MEKVERRYCEKRLVRRILDHQSLTWKAFAEEHCEVSAAFLREYFRANKDSDRVAACVECLIDKHFEEALGGFMEDYRVFQKQAA